MKKYLKSVLYIVLATVFAFGFSSCKNNEKASETTAISNSNYVESAKTYVKAASMFNFYTVAEMASNFMLADMNYTKAEYEAMLMSSTDVIKDKKINVVITEATDTTANNKVKLNEILEACNKMCDNKELAEKYKLKKISTNDLKCVYVKSTATVTGKSPQESEMTLYLVNENSSWKVINNET